MPVVTPLANVKTPVPYSLASPVVCHAVQIVPTAACRLWVEEIRWVAERTPEIATTWQTQKTAFGMTGYLHVQKIEAAWASSANVTVQITAFDGTAPANLTLPSTGGVYQKGLFFLTFNKGQLYSFKATSNNAFQVFLNDWRVWARQWGSDGPYVPVQLLGGQYGDNAAI